MGARKQIGLERGVGCLPKILPLTKSLVTVVTVPTNPHPTPAHSHFRGPLPNL